MKGHAAAILALILCLAAAGCSSSGSVSNANESSFTVSEDTPASSTDSSTDSKPSDESSGSDQKTRVGNTEEIVDKDGRHIGEITAVSTTLTNKGIFYTVNESDKQSVDEYSISDNNTVVYCLYDPEKNESYDLGSIPGQDYEAGYARTELNGRLYTLITTGNALDNTPDPLILLQFDLDSRTIKQFTISDNGFPYTAMTAVNGKLLVLNHDQTDILKDRIYLFDPDTEKTEQVLEFELKDNKGDTIRNMYSDGESIYILRLVFDGENNVRMMLDTYGTDFKKTAETDISDIFRKAASESRIAVSDMPNEMMQMVSRFIILDRSNIYYENFSVTHFLADISTSELYDISKGTDSILQASSGSGKPFFFHAYDMNSDEKAVYEWNSGKLEKKVINTDDSRYYITWATAAPDGRRLTQMEYLDPGNSNNKLPIKLYYM